MARNKDKKPRPLGDVLQEFRDKVIKAASKLQEELSASAEQPASSTVEHSAPIDTADSVDLDEDLVLLDVQLRREVTSDEQPAQTSADPEQPNSRAGCQGSSQIHASSAAQPASQSNANWQPESLQDCSNWLNAISAQEMAQSKPLQRLQSATTVLQKRSSRQQREEVQQLLDHWGVPQKAQKRKRSYNELEAELLANVVQETRRLKSMQRISEASDLHAYASTTGACFSAITASLQTSNAPRQA